MDAIPLWGFFLLTIGFVVGCLEAGYGLGRIVLRRPENEKESSVSAIVGANLGLLAFLLAFTFGIVSDRYDARKALVREEANAIRTAYLRSDFLPEPDRGEAVKLFREYVNFRIEAAQSRDLKKIRKTMPASGRIQRRLWDMAVVNARKDMNSDVAALYIESLNQLIDLHALRVAVGLQARMPVGIWVALGVLIILGMIGVGFMIAIGGSRRSWTTPILAISFSVVIILLVSLDRPQSGFMVVSQQPLVDVRSSMDADAASDAENMPK